MPKESAMRAEAATNPSMMEEKARMRRVRRVRNRAAAIQAVMPISNTAQTKLAAREVLMNPQAAVVNDASVQKTRPFSAPSR